VASFQDLRSDRFAGERSLDGFDDGIAERIGLDLVDGRASRFGGEASGDDGRFPSFSSTARQDVTGILGCRSNGASRPSIQSSRVIMLADAASNGEGKGCNPWAKRRRDAG
jgi:hypothetical protein